MRMTLLACLAAAATAVLAAARPQDPSKERLRVALKDHDLVGTWYYDDLPGAMREAKRADKPLLVVFR